jgi:predicted dehydrogenase
MFHAPMLTASPLTSLEAVWARRLESAQELVATHGGVAVERFDELLDRVEAVAFSVPPDVQADLAPLAAAAGKHLLLEKPLAFTLEEAERITTAVDEAGVRTLMVLRNRFTRAGRSFVETARASSARGGQASFVTGAALPGSPFATPWRIERGAVYDLAPHVLDLMDAAMGRVVDLTATGDPRRWVSIVTHHEGGALGQTSLSITTPHVPGTMQVSVTTEDGVVVFDGARSDEEPDVGEALMTAWTTAIETGVDAEVDVHRGLHLQRLLVEAEDQLA